MEAERHFGNVADDTEGLTRRLTDARAGHGLSPASQ